MFPFLTFHHTPVSVSVFYFLFCSSFCLFLFFCSLSTLLIYYFFLFHMIMCSVMICKSASSPFRACQSLCPSVSQPVSQYCNHCMKKLQNKYRIRKAVKKGPGPGGKGLATKKKYRFWSSTKKFWKFFCGL